MGKRKTYEEVYEIFKSKGYELLDREYIDSKTKMAAVDSDGYKIFTHIMNFLKCDNVSMFGNGNPYTLHNIIKYIELHDIKLEYVSGEYMSNTSELVFRCKECNSITMKSWADISNGSVMCKTCMKKRAADLLRSNLDDVRMLFRKQGLTLLCDSYIDSKTQMECEDADGYKYMISAGSIKSGYTPNKVSPTNKYSIQNIKRWLSLNKTGIELISNEYSNNETIMVWRCECGLEMNKTWAAIRYNPVCTSCSRIKNIQNQKYSNDVVINDFINSGYEPLFSEYINYSTKMLVRNKDGYLLKMSYDNLKNNESPTIFGKHNEHTIHNISKYIELNKINAKLISDKYVSNSDRLIFECSCGNKFTTSWASFSSGKKLKCDKCVKEKIKKENSFSYDYVRNHIDSYGCKLLSDNYENNESKLSIKCRCGNIFTATLNRFNGKAQRQCPDCSELIRKSKIRNKSRDTIFSDGRFYPCDFCEETNEDKCYKCKVYKYFKRNKRNLLYGWTGKEYNTIIDCVSNDKVECINDIVPMLDSKTVGDVVEIMNKELVTYYQSNATKLRTECACCGKTMYRRRGEWDKERLYCSMECRDVVRSELFVGENSPSFNSKKVNCTNCGKELVLPPHKYNSVNTFGDNHNFCSHECYWEFRGSYYSGDKWLAEHEYTEEERESSRIRMAKMISDGVIPQTMTKPHVIINNLLDEMGIEYENEHNLKYQSVDIYCEQYNLMIEIMGDYWHGHPLKYEYYDDLTFTQKKSVTQDKRKHTYVKKYHDREILYLWESDINNNIELCKELIKSYIKNNGNLYDYHSYNYYLNDGSFGVNDICFYPHFM